MSRAVLGLGLVAALAAATAPVRGDESEAGRDFIRKFVERYASKQTPPEELVGIIAATQKHDADAAIRLCDELIARDESRFRSKSAASWLKSEAYRYRAEAIFSQHQDLNEAVDLLKPAADAGNLLADKKITEILWRKAEGDAAYAAVRVDPDELSKYLHVGAELGDAMSAMMLGASNSPAKLDESEKTYWSLIGLALAVHDTVEFRRHMMATVAKRATEEGVAAALKRYSLLPPTTPPGPGALPGRGWVATVYADAMLRTDYGYSYGRRGSEGVPDHPTPSVQEVFKGNQAYADVLQDVRAFLLVPGSRTFADPAILSLPPDQLAAAIGPSDYVFVRCGALTHVAMVHHVDRAADRVYLSDGLWQFWQPSHNSCVTRFELTSFAHGGYLAVVPFSELDAMAEAVSTLRDRP